MTHHGSRASRKLQSLGTHLLSSCAPASPSECGQQGGLSSACLARRACRQMHQQQPGQRMACLLRCAPALLGGMC
eukprot:13911802-Alexandrium_andersonii.AAC.2